MSGTPAISSAAWGVRHSVGVPVHAGVESLAARHTIREIAAFKDLAHAFASASASMLQSSAAMIVRGTTSVATFRNNVERFMASVAHLQRFLKFSATARTTAAQHVLEKAADDFEAIAAIMDAGAEMSNAVRMPAGLTIAGLLPLEKLAHTAHNIAVDMCMPTYAYVPSVLAMMRAMTTVWAELPSRSTSEATGRGMQCFVKGTAGRLRNIVSVHPRVVSGAIAEYTTPDDVRFMLMDDAGCVVAATVTVQWAADTGSGMQIAFEVASDCTNNLRVSVTVCGVLIGPARVIRSGYDALPGDHEVASFDIAAGGPKEGLAVSTDGRMLAVTFARTHMVRVYCCSPSLGALTPACTFGRQGARPAEFNTPRRLCFTDIGALLVCDCKNNRVQHLTDNGEFLGSFDVQEPCSVALQQDVVAVGSLLGYIETHSLATGELLNRFGSRGAGPGQFGGHATGICFSPEGTCLVVAEYDSRRLSVFTVSGIFVKHFGVGVLSIGVNDVLFSSGGEIVVCDQKHDRLCVFSPDGVACIKTWGSEGAAAGQFQNPRALCVAGSHLFVLDNTRVQVFE